MGSKKDVGMLVFPVDLLKDFLAVVEVTFDEIELVVTLTEKDAKSFFDELKQGSCFIASGCAGQFGFAKGN